MGINSCLFSGMVVGEPALKFSQAGKPFLKFTVSVSSFWGGETKYTPFFCTMFGERAEKIVSLVAKGARVTVAATYTFEEYEDREGNKRTSPGFIVQDIDIQKYSDESGKAVEEEVEEDNNPPF